MAMSLLKEKEAVETSDRIENTIQYYRQADIQFLVEQFLIQVVTFFERNPALHEEPFPVVHSVKSRIKKADHLEDKLKRKAEQGIIITPDTLFGEITDLAGVRVLHLHQDQFEIIHSEIIKKLLAESGFSLRNLKHILGIRKQKTIMVSSA